MHKMRLSIHDWENVNAIYQFINDFFQLERSTGFYYVLRSGAERDAFFERLDAFLIDRIGND